MTHARRLKTAVLYVVWLLMIVICTAPNVQADPSVRFKLVQKHLIVALVSVNGQGPFEFLIDTGTHLTLVDPLLVEELQLKSSTQVSLMTISGKQSVPRSVLKSVQVGTALLEHLEALTVDLTELRRVRPQIRGMLGQNFLSRFNYLIDYHNQRIVFEEHQEFEHQATGTRLPFVLDSGKILISAQTSNHPAGELQLILDSGTPGLMLFEPTLQTRKVPVERNGGFIMMAAATTGVRPTQTGRLARVRVGDEFFENLPVTFVRGDSIAKTFAANGLLPTNLFQTLYVNNQKKFVVMNAETEAGMVVRK